GGGGRARLLACGRRRVPARALGLAGRDRRGRGVPSRSGERRRRRVLAGARRLCSERARGRAGRSGVRGRARRGRGRGLRASLRRVAAPGRRRRRSERGNRMNRRVLFVDDELAVLEGIRRNLRKDFEVHTATDPRAALAALGAGQPFAVIVADMRMPGMDGVEFLYQARKAAPSSVRLMLTGDADRATAIGAVNRGDVFKFLTKPCDAEVLRKVVELAIRQHDVALAEKEMLENTVRASVNALAEVLALAKPIAFGRVHRLRSVASAI